MSNLPNPIIECRGYQRWRTGSSFIVQMELAIVNIEAYPDRLFVPDDNGEPRLRLDIYKGQGRDRYQRVHDPSFKYGDISIKQFREGDEDAPKFLFIEFYDRLEDRIYRSNRISTVRSQIQLSNDTVFLLQVKLLMEVEDSVYEEVRIGMIGPKEDFSLSLPIPRDAKITLWIDNVSLFYMELSDGYLNERITYANLQSPPNSTDIFTIVDYDSVYVPHFTYPSDIVSFDNNYPYPIIGSYFQGPNNWTRLDTLDPIATCEQGTASQVESGMLFMFKKSSPNDQPELAAVLVDIRGGRTNYSLYYDPRLILQDREVVMSALVRHFGEETEASVTDYTATYLQTIYQQWEYYQSLVKKIQSPSTPDGVDPVLFRRPFTYRMMAYNIISQYEYEFYVDSRRESRVVELLDASIEDTRMEKYLYGEIACRALDVEPGSAISLLADTLNYHESMEVQQKFDTALKLHQDHHPEERRMRDLESPDIHFLSVGAVLISSIIIGLSLRAKENHALLAGKHQHTVQDMVNRLEGVLRRPSARAQLAIRYLASPRAHSPYVQYVNQMKGKLQREGIYGSAKKVPIFVCDVGTAHGRQVCRVIGGPESLANDAQLYFLPLLKKWGLRGITLANYLDRIGSKIVVDEEEAKRLNRYYTLRKRGFYSFTLEILKEFVKLSFEMTLFKRRVYLDLVAQKYPGNQTSLVNMSFSKSVYKVINSFLLKGGGTAGAKISEDIPLVVADVKSYLCQECLRYLNEGSVLSAIEDKFKQALKKYREEDRILLFTSPGNQHKEATELGNEGYGHADTAYIDGLITIGAVDLEDPKDLTDDTVAFFSGPNVTLVAPGVNIPVKEPIARSKQLSSFRPRTSLPDNNSGTSFATPFAVSVAARMLAVNPSLTPDNILSILKSGNATTSLEDSRAGVGVINPYKAVKAALAFRE